MKTMKVSIGSRVFLGLRGKLYRESFSSSSRLETITGKAPLGKLASILVKL
jgi:hypothetical protein